jgi:hypothetical protein
MAYKKRVSVAWVVREAVAEYIAEKQEKGDLLETERQLAEETT